jgi:hypothetical protein
MPSYPPMSPVTTSHFAMWPLFDVQFGPSREAIGSRFLRIAGLTEMTSCQPQSTSFAAARGLNGLRVSSGSGSGWASKIPVHKMDSIGYIMKHCACAAHCKEAVFLPGIPDIGVSLPHA